MFYDLAAIRPGDEIEYEQDASRVNRAHLKTNKGKVIQVTDTSIAIKGELYPTSILINDLISGQAKIIKLRGEDAEMAPQRRDAPPLGELQASYTKNNGVVAKVAEDFKAGWKTAERWLVEAGIITAEGVPVLQTPTPEPVQVGRQEPDQESKESAKESLPKVEDSVKDKECQYGQYVNWAVMWPKVLELKETGLSMPKIADKLGIKYSSLKDKVAREKAKSNPVKRDLGPSLDGLKLDMMDLVRGYGLPNSIQLQIIGEIQNMQLPEAG